MRVARFNPSTVLWVLPVAGCLQLQSYESRSVSTCHLLIGKYCVEEDPLLEVVGFL